uniref:Uncharacterized protein n=1 Tax=viral metagenome TaxID=1070528 RepID=A0A6C0CGY6_9ZZZZ
MYRNVVYGIGIPSNDPRINDMSSWRGHNLLGKVLTEVRRRLSPYRSGLQNYANSKMVDLISTHLDKHYIDLWQIVTAEWRQLDEDGQAN